MERVSTLVSLFLVVVATPLVLIAALVFVPVGWLAAAGVVLLVVGVVVALVSRHHRRHQLLETPADL